MPRYRLWKPGVCGAADTLLEDMDLESSWLGRIWSDREEEGSKCRGAKSRSVQVRRPTSWGGGRLYSPYVLGTATAQGSQQNSLAPEGLTRHHRLSFRLHRDLLEKLVVRWKHLYTKGPVQICPIPKKKNPKFYPADTGQGEQSSYINWWEQPALPLYFCTTLSHLEWSEKQS